MIPHGAKQLEEMIERAESMKNDAMKLSSEASNGLFIHGIQPKARSFAAKKASASANHVSAREGRVLKRGAKRAQPMLLTLPRHLRDRGGGI